MFFRKRGNELFALFFLACATLLFQVTATKIFEFSVWANYAYLVISTAMFGLGMSGVILTRWPNLLKLNETGFLIFNSAGTAIAILTGFLVLNNVPIHLPDAPDGWWFEFRNVAVVFLALSIPFLFMGFVVSFLFEHRGEHANVYYFFDLVGAGLGCVLLVPLIHTLEPQGLVTLASLMSMVSAVLFCLTARENRGLAKAIVVAGMAVLILTGFFVAPRAATLVTINVHVPKRSYKQDVKNGVIEAYGWSALSRVDIAKAGKHFKRVWIAGGVNWSAIPQFDGDFEKARAERSNTISRAEQFLDYHALPHLSKSNHTVCVIGTSGGEDSLMAISYGSIHVTGVEMDPMIAKFVRETNRDYAGKLFTDGKYSEMIVDEGRSYIRRSNRQFDVIQQVNNFTPIAFQNGALNLSETYLLTVESFQDFYDHLSPDGILSISRYGTIRMMSIAVEMFRRMGMKPEEYSKHLFVGEGPVWVINTFMMKKSPFTPEEIDRLYAFYEAGVHDRKIVYAPYRSEELPNLTNNLYYKIATAEDPKPYWKLGCFDFSPTTDQKPFFNRMKTLGMQDRKRDKLADLPGEVFNIERGNVLRKRVPTGDLPPLIILTEALILSTVFFGVPLLTKRELRNSVRKHRRALGFFACLGIGFIFVEICLIQRLLLFLGAPVYSLATVLASLLVAAGIGSLVSGRIEPNHKNIRRCLSAAALSILVLHLVLPFLTTWFLDNSLAVRILVSVVITGIAGFFMGMPMPLGIRFLTKKKWPIISWAWAMNGYFTVIGSALSVVVASTMGFGVVFYSAIAIYLAAPYFLNVNSDTEV